MGKRSQEPHDPIQSRPSSPFDGAKDRVLEAWIAPGLTPGFEELRSLSSEVPDHLNAVRYKTVMPCLWVVLVGGTGTGKSTLFNALCEENLSLTGVERPKTIGPVAYAHAQCPIQERFPFPEVRPQRYADSRSRPQGGEPGRLAVLEHRREDLAHLVLVDSPDLDSVEEENRTIARKLALLADVIVFVTSQEKYADEAPSVFLRHLLDEEKAVYGLLNKADEGFTSHAAVDLLKTQGVIVEENRLWLVPRIPDPSWKTLGGQPGFRAFRDRFGSDLSPERAALLRERRLRADSKRLAARLSRLETLIQDEEKAGREWIKQLRDLCRKTCNDLVASEKEQFASKNRARIQKEIRRLFSRYDPLARPRRAIRNALRVPLRLIGLGTDRVHGRQGPIQTSPQPADMAPVLAALDRFHSGVLERLSPTDSRVPLHAALRAPGVSLSPAEVEARLNAERQSLEAWLEQTFEALRKGLPTAKKWSIYSTSAVWGVLILSLEATLGGGFGVIDAVLDSALAPFITKGSAELFAYREIRAVAREMADRYRQGLFNILEEQQKRYEDALQSVRTPSSTLEHVSGLQQEFAP
jgi:hypothetical protein